MNTKKLRVIGPLLAMRKQKNTFIVITEIREKGKRRYRGYKNVKNILEFSSQVNNNNYYLKVKINTSYGNIEINI